MSIRIVLLNTSHPGNIGAAARAMKTMGLHELFLVAPKFFPHPDATALATHAEDILTQAQVTRDVIAALEDVTTVYATSANTRASIPIIDARTAAQQILAQPAQKTAVLFGPENYGLSNDILQQCHFQIQIPTAANYHSLNLAAAVQVVCYELLMAARQQVLPSSLLIAEALATMPETAHFYAQLRETLIQLDFLDPRRPRQLMPRLRRLFNRAQLTRTELNILLGILRAIAEKTNT